LLINHIIFKMKRIPVPSNADVLKNTPMLNIPMHLSSYDPAKKYYIMIGKFVYNLEHKQELKKNEIAIAAYQRNETTDPDTNNLKIYDYDTMYATCIKLDQITIQISLEYQANKSKTTLTLSKDTFIPMIRKYLIDSKMFVSDRQKIAFSHDTGTFLSLVLITQSSTHATITQETEFKLKEGNSNIIIEGNSILKINLNLVAMGIGGLDSQFNAMFRRAFSSRLLEPQTVKKLNVKHIKGILLHGPPGCGKTLIARQICKMINSVEPKIVNGPDILNKYVGQSEENMRDLFADAEAEYKKKGECSRLHVIVFDEIDSLCHKRGSGGNNIVNDTIVNQLLTKFDGVNPCNNFIIIGMTNRPDMIDDALLRPGRFELQLQISLPDERGREQILEIHTKALAAAKKLANQVNIVYLAKRTKNYTGAEIEGLVNLARSYAIHRAINFNQSDPANPDINGSPQLDESKIIVTEQDFSQALSEIQPKFGLDNSVIDQMSRYGIMMYSNAFEVLYGNMQIDIKNFIDSKSELMVIYIGGVAGSGRTNLALDIARKTNFPCIKYITGQSVIGMLDTRRCNFIKEYFDDATKSPQSVLVLDDMENIIDWVYCDITGSPRFSLPVCIAFKALIKYVHPNKKLIICTFDSDSLPAIRRIKILPTPNRTYIIPDTEIDDTTQGLISEVDDVPYEKKSINAKQPIKRYIFEYNKTTSIDYQDPDGFDPLTSADFDD
jgi:vesicle-fusing ATPase